MYYNFKIKKDKQGYVASCIELEGCRTEADTKEELLDNMSEAVNLFLDEPPSSSHIFPAPKEHIKSKNVIKVEVDSRIAFAMLLRQARLKSKRTQAEVAREMGFKSIYAYQKLESSTTANPTLTTLEKIKKILPKFNFDILFEAQ